jgi:hypothetical protein
MAVRVAAAKGLAEPVFRYFSNDRAFASDLNAIAVSMGHGRHLAVYVHVPLIVLVQARWEVLRDAGVGFSRISFAYEHINIEKFSTPLACQAVVLERKTEQIKHEPPALHSGVAAFALGYAPSEGWA